MTIALLLSGGIGTRIHADKPKQYITVNGQMLITYSLLTILGHEGIDAVQIIASSEWHSNITNDLPQQEKLKDKMRGFSQPGENRQQSILNGLTDILRYAKPDDLVFIHDAARPLLSVNMISDCLHAIGGYDGVMPVLPMKDTVYLSENGNEISKLCDRKCIFAGQAPELFRLGRYYEANLLLLPNRIKLINGSGEPAVLAGMKIAMIPGDERNFKVTTAVDLERFHEMTAGKRFERTQCT
ncbi:MAG: 2-C-methyl-D-erythritol 4-phosphate cytidylyltransferase [Lachnospiraceae bacterium]|nr:2-C-methyl-D-erythritol 4-phosphate cytidylyltransferase [Lachnospiraceae bacterium]